jgi:hypothetical protein
LLGQLADGSFAFQAHAIKREHPSKAEALVAVSKPESGVHEVQLPAEPHAGTQYLSPSGKYVAYIEERTTPDYRRELHVWVKDLHNREQKDLFVAPPPNPPASPEPNETVTILGWVDN